MAAPALGPAALALAKLGRLLPAVLAAPAVPDAQAVAAGLGLLSVPAQDVLDYPVGAAAGLRQVAEASVPLEDAPQSRIIAFRTADAAIEHLAIVIGNPAEAASPLVRIHSECFTGDLLGSLRCDCGSQLRGAIQRMAAEGSGVLLYLAQEGRGIGLVNKLRAYALQDRGLDTLDANRALGWGADERSFMIAATMLQILGVDRVRLLTNNPDKLAALAACGIAVVGARVARVRRQRGERQVPRHQDDPLRPPARMSLTAAVFPDGRFLLRGEAFRAALGRGGVRTDKAEGDGATPAGLLPLRRVLYRADRGARPSCAVPAEPLSPDDGWCDDPAHADYNTMVRLPHPARHERLWRDDAIYDLIGVLGWNDRPVTRGHGSAIFLHLARPDFAPTEGCIALPGSVLRHVLGAGLDAIEVQS